jgi:septal ring factor EnvC (AmiA/AmiB activator)
LQAIRDALTQADVKASAVGPALPPLPDFPAPTGAPAPMPPGAPLPETPARGVPALAPAFGAPAALKETRGLKVEEMERILEEIVDERWKDVTKKFSDLETSRVKTETKTEELSKRVSELASRLDEISSVIMGKVDEYKKTMEDVDVEIKALEKVMQKLVPSMAEQVKELKNVVGGFKSKPLE